MRAPRACWREWTITSPSRSSRSSSLPLSTDGCRIPRRSKIKLARADPQPEGAIDRQVLNGLRKVERAGAPGLVKKVTDLFLEDTPRQLTDLRDSAQRGDCARLAKLAHTLKGSAANLGAHEMVRVCGELEALGQDGDVSIVPSLVADLESQFNSVRDALLCRLHSPLST